MKLVIDTNVIIAALSSKSKYHWLIQWLIEGRYELCITEEIYLEYEEKLTEKYSIGIARSFLKALKELANVVSVNISYNWQLIQADPDDNKFADCCIAANALFLITNDKHFRILETVKFPKINVINLEDFEQYCNGGLTTRTINKEHYKIEVDSEGLTIFCKEYSSSGYPVNKEWLTKIDNNNSKLSDLILHLSEKLWVSDKIDLLYDIAQIIQSSFPMNMINWKATFCHVAYDKYIHYLKEIKDEKEETASYFDQILKGLKISADESNEKELFSNLEKGVESELKKRGII